MFADIWQDFLTIVREEVGSRVVETWLKAVAVQQWDLDSKTLYIEAPNTFVKEWIQSRYTKLFEHHLGRLFNTAGLKVVFLSKVSQSDQPVKDSLATIIPAKLSNVSHEIKHELVRKTNTGYTRLNPTYKFDSFVVGPSNSLAYAAARAVADEPGRLYNPLFIYGGSGLGKTHLLHAIGNALLEKHPKCVVLYQTADRFVNEFINGIRFNKFHEFQQKYRELDVLLIDDIQFISNKEQTQEAFFHIFNTLHEAHKQIVFSSDIFPRHITGLAERLRSRLEWGLVTDIHKPPLETKIAILKKKAAVHGEMIDDALAEYIAQYAESNVRELEGSLVRVLAFASLTKQPITLELAHRVLGGQKVERKTHKIDFTKIAEVVCEHYSYRLTDLRSNNRAKELSLARQVAMYLMKKMTDKSLREIGTFLGRRDHSTVIHAFDKVQKGLECDPALKSAVQSLEEAISR